ncbi:MAG: DNA repair protein RecO [Phycisphaerae bacterium]|jgi:DNA repair protein RecO (recombination protein O)
MPAQTDQAIVVRVSDFSETSQVCSLLTREFGLVRLIAKGLRRSTRVRFAVGVDLLERGTASFVRARGAGLSTLTEWVQASASARLRAALPRLYAGLYAAELVPYVMEEFDPHPTAFDALVVLLDALESDASLAPAVARFQAALLRAIGLAPNFRSCADCGRARGRLAHGYFSATAGGWLCMTCAPRHAEKMRLPRTLQAADLASASAEDWFDVLDYHLAHIAGRRAQTREALRRMLTVGRAHAAPRRG